MFSMVWSIDKGGFLNFILDCKDECEEGERYCALELYDFHFFRAAQKTVLEFVFPLTTT